MRSLWRAAGPLQQGSLYMLLALLPFSNAAVEISFGLLLLGWVLARLNPATRFDTIWTSKELRPLAIAVGVFLGVCAASILVSNFPHISLRGLIGKWVEYLLLFMIVADVARQPRVAKRALRVFAWSALGVVTYAITQSLFLIKTKPYDHHPLWFYKRMIGPYENPIDLATYLMVAGFILLTYAMIQRGRARWRVGALVALIVLCLAETRAVGAWLGVYAGLLVMVVVSPAIRRVGLVALIVMVVAGGVIAQREGRLRGVVELSDAGMMDRWVMWQAALKMVRDRPVLGHGVNTFMANYMTYWVGGERQPRYAHNCYLQVAAETGLIGLASFLTLLGLLGAQLMNGVRRVGHADASLLLLGCLGGLVAFLVQAGVDTNFYSLRQAALFWTVAGLALGMSLQARRVSS